MSWGEGDRDRRLAGVVRFGRVTAVDPAAARARVFLGGEAESTWLPWLAERASKISVWAPVAVGEQVVVVSPSGDTAQGVIAGSVFSAANGAPSSDPEEYLITIGGSSVSVTPDAITFRSNGSTLRLDASGVHLDGAQIRLNG